MLLQHLSRGCGALNLGRAAAGHTRASHRLVPPVSGAEGGVRGRSSRCAGAEHPAGDGGRAGQGAKQDAKHLRGDLPWPFPRGAAGLGTAHGEEFLGWHRPCSVPGGCPQPPWRCCLAVSLPAPPRALCSPGWEAAMPSGTAPALGARRGPVGLRGPQTLSQCSFQPAGCQLPLLPALCLSLLLLQTVGVTRGAPHPNAPLSVVAQTPHFRGSTPHLSHLPGPEPASPLLPATHRTPAGLRERGRGALLLPSPLSSPPSSFLTLCACPNPAPLCPRPLSLSLPGATLSHSLILCRWT